MRLTCMLRYTGLRKDCRSQIADYHEKMQQMWSDESPHDVLSIVVRCYDIYSSKIRFSKKVMQVLKDLANDEGMLTLIPMPRETSAAQIADYHSKC